MYYSVGGDRTGVGKARERRAQRLLDRSTSRNGQKPFFQNASEHFSKLVF